MKKTLFFAVFLSFVFFGVGLVSAQETQLAVTPAIIDAPVVAGQSVSKKIMITNGSSFALPVSIEVQPAILDGELIDGAQAERFKVQQWVVFAESTYVLEPGETKEIPFTITAPFNAAAGGSYAQISIRGLSIEQNVEGQATGLIFPEVAVPLLITIPGDIVEDARIVLGDIFPAFATPNSPLTTNFKVENIGTVHNLVSARIIIEKQGEFVRDIVVQPAIILPETQKILSSVWQTPDYGKYEISIELTFGNKSRTYRSNPETIYITPPLNNLAVLIAVTWTSLYLWPRRNHVKAALKTLLTGN